MTTVVKRSIVLLSGDRDRDLSRVREGVEHRRVLLRLGDQRLYLLLGGVSVDVEAHLDVVVAVADISIAEDPSDVVIALDRRLDRAQLLQRSTQLSPGSAGIVARG
jgi:hypothetical protein